MLISIFPKAKALPKTKEEKDSEARFVSKPHKPEITKIDTEDDLIETICNNTWSPFIFKEYRVGSGFLSTDVIAFDIDSGMTISEAETQANKLKLTCLCLPSTSHTPEDHRFRLIFPLVRTITNPLEYKATYSKLAEYFSVDPACKDLARFYYGSKMIDGFWLEGDLLVPTRPEKPKKNRVGDFDSRDTVIVGKTIEDLVEALYGEKREKIPESVAYFLEHAPDDLTNEWFVRSNAFLFTLGLQGVKYEQIIKVFYSLYPHDVNSRIEHGVDKIIKEGYNLREEEDEL